MCHFTVKSVSVVWWAGVCVRARCAYYTQITNKYTLLFAFIMLLSSNLLPQNERGSPWITKCKSHCCFAAKAEMNKKKVMKNMRLRYLAFGDFFNLCNTNLRGEENSKSRPNPMQPDFYGFFFFFASWLIQWNLNHRI